ncbi:hypothetical protein AB4Z51_03300 [Bradyrhizobium sp. 2TAF36]|uniref:hypothetical protein n=1 Tax=Bradyrhizobium sp. 2TAF36 TaxID=3233016 RepID=UPI003F913A73
MPDDDDRLNALALSIMAAGHVEDLREAGDETAALVRELLSLPDIPDRDLTKREAMLALLLWKKTEAAKRLLALVVSGM